MITVSYYDCIVSLTVVESDKMVAATEIAEPVNNYWE